MQLFILLLVRLNKWNEIDWTLIDKDDLTIYDAICHVLILYNATLTNAHWLIAIVASNVDLTLPLCLECDDRVVVQLLRELHVIGITSMRQICRLVKLLVPLVAFVAASRIVKATLGLSQDLDSRKNFPWGEQNVIED